ncbi:hypothetical protein DFQ30_001892 [Apophysomyces sp. BC1015]|nr:hypothetical protein DFQ30_001892 [Apophysomyces sp. BC1015]
MNDSMTLSPDVSSTNQETLAVAATSDAPVVVSQQHDTVLNNATITEMSVISPLTVIEDKIQEPDTQPELKAPETIGNGSTETTEANIDAAIANGENVEAGYQSSDIGEEETESKGQQKPKKVQMDDLEEDDVNPDQVLRTAHEITDLHIERPSFEIRPETTLLPVGEIYRLIDKVIVVQSFAADATPVLDMGTLFVYDDRVVMGEIFETFGPVARPFYSVRYNMADEIDKERSVVGAKVYYVPSYEKTQLVEVEKLKLIKGSDASNLYDEEAGEDDVSDIPWMQEIEFSDDEKEMEFKRNRKRKRPAAKGERRAGPKKPNVAPTNSDDFGAALAAYGEQQGVNPAPPGREIQSYADIAGGQQLPRQPQNLQPPALSRPAFPTYHNQQSNISHYPPQQQPSNHGQPPSSTYQTPADLVSALFKSYGGNLPSNNPLTQPSTAPSQPSTSSEPARRSVRALFAEPPPPSTDDE